MASKQLLILGMLLAASTAAPQFNTDEVQTIPHEFAYGVEAAETGDVKEHKQTVSPSGRTEGEYRWLQPNGLFIVVRYFVDGDSGFQAVVSEEPGPSVGNYYTNSFTQERTSGAAPAVSQDFARSFDAQEQSIGRAANVISVPGPTQAPFLPAQRPTQVPFLPVQRPTQAPFQRPSQDTTSSAQRPIQTTISPTPRPAFRPTAASRPTQVNLRPAPSPDRVSFVPALARRPTEASFQRPSQISLPTPTTFRPPTRFSQLNGATFVPALRQQAFRPIPAPRPNQAPLNTQQPFLRVADGGFIDGGIIDGGIINGGIIDDEEFDVSFDDFFEDAEEILERNNRFRS